MKPRRVRISLEVTTDAPLKALKDKTEWDGIAVSDGSKFYLLTVHQVLADVQQVTKETKLRRR